MARNLVSHYKRGSGLRPANFCSEARIIARNHDQQRLARWQKLAFAFIALTHVAISFHEILRPFFVGHQGWNAALRSLIGRNYVKYGFFETGFAPYKHFGMPETLAGMPIHWNHPPLVNLLVGLNFEIFGVHEWAANLVAAVPAALLIFVLFAVVRRRWGANVALAACAILAVLPMQVEYGKMLNYEVQIVLATLVAIYCAIRYRECQGRERIGWGAGAAIALCVAGSFDWPGFVLAAFVGFDALAREPKRPWLFVAIGVATSLTLAGWFFWLDGLATGKGLIGLAEWRSSADVTLSALADKEFTRMMDYFGPAALVFALVGCIGSIVRERELDPTITTFFLGNLLYISIFRQAASVHNFYLYFMTPAIAVAAALGLKMLFELLGEYFGARLAGWIAGFALLGILVSTATRLPETHLRSYGVFPPNHPAPAFPYLGELNRALVGKLIHERTERGDTIAFHRRSGSSLQMRYYADRAYRWHNSNSVPRNADFWVAPERSFDRANVRRLATKYRITRIANLMLIDLNSSKTGVETLAIRELPTTLAHWYLVSSVVPRWEVVLDTRSNRRFTRRLARQ